MAPAAGLPAAIAYTRFEEGRTEGRTVESVHTSDMFTLMSTDISALSEYLHDFILALTLRVLCASGAPHGRWEVPGTKSLNAERAGKKAQWWTER
jgi:hypothetical protein